MKQLPVDEFKKHIIRKEKRPLIIPHEITRDPILTELYVEAIKRSQPPVLVMDDEFWQLVEGQR